MSDFDQTLTKLAFTDGKKADPTFKVIQDHKKTPDFIKQEGRDMYMKYYKIEQRKDLTFEQKMEGIHNWWRRDLEIFTLPEARFSKEMCIEAIFESKLLYRRGYGSFLKLAQEGQIPFFIVSAGLGDIIDISLQVLKEGGEIEHSANDPVRIISNFFKFKDVDGAQIISDWDRDYVHIFNKREKIYKTKDVGLEKKNVILLGDIKQDCQMCDASKHESVLKVGFYNSLATAKHPGDLNIDVNDFASAFDLVIENDASLLPIVFLLQEILKVPVMTPLEMTSLKNEDDTFSRLSKWLV